MRNGFFKGTRLIILVSALIASLRASSALASSPVYTEFGAGLSSITYPSPFFLQAGSSASAGVGSQFTIGFSLSDSHSRVQYHLGLQHRLSTGSSNGLSLGMQSIYPIFRLELSTFFISIGISPFLIRRAQEQAGINGYQRAQNAMSFMAELGYRWEITPEISFGLSTAAQTVLQEDQVSPRPVIDFIGAIRIYYGKTASPAGSPDEDALRGWRYPYGNQIP